MPYIKARDVPFPYNVGELTYTLTMELKAYYERGGMSFAVLAECLAALEATKLEFYRRVVAPYEDEKMEQNGDVY